MDRENRMGWKGQNVRCVGASKMGCASNFYYQTTPLTPCLLLLVNNCIAFGDALAWALKISSCCSVVLSRLRLIWSWLAKKSPG